MERIFSAVLSFTILFTVSCKHAESNKLLAENDAKTRQDTDPFILTVDDDSTGNISSWDQLIQFDSHGSLSKIVGAAFGPTGDIFATSGTTRNADSNYGISIWDIESRKLIRTIDVGAGLPKSSPGFSSDGKYVYILNGSSRPAVYDVNTGTKLWIGAHTDSLISSNQARGKLVTAGSGVSIWDINTGNLDKRINTWKGVSDEDGRLRRGGISSVSITMDGEKAVVAYAEGYVADVWDTTDGHLIESIRHKRDQYWPSDTGPFYSEIRTAFYDHGGKNVLTKVTGTGNGQCNFQQVCKPTYWPANKDGNIFSKDDAYVLLKRYEKTGSATLVSTVVVDVKTGNVLASLPMPKDKSYYEAYGFSFDGRYVLLTKDLNNFDLRLWKWQ